MQKPFRLKWVSGYIPEFILKLHIPKGQVSPGCIKAHASNLVYVCHTSVSKRSTTVVDSEIGIGRTTRLCEGNCIEVRIVGISICSYENCLNIVRGPKRDVRPHSIQVSYRLSMNGDAESE